MSIKSAKAKSHFSPMPYLAMVIKKLATITPEDVMMEITLKSMMRPVVNPATNKTEATRRSNPRYKDPSKKKAEPNDQVIATTDKTKLITANTVARTGNFLNSN